MEESNVKGEEYRKLIGEEYEEHEERTCTLIMTDRYFNAPRTPLRSSSGRTIV
jgi:hypothetical protein